jgi:hypothetical protein
MPAIIEPQGAPEPDAPAPPLVSRLLWFFGLALGGVVATAAVAYGLRTLMRLG